MKKKPTIDQLQKALKKGSPVRMHLLVRMIIVPIIVSVVLFIGLCSLLYFQDVYIAPYWRLPIGGVMLVVIITLVEIIDFTLIGLRLDQ